jgi:uncharacterized SAM-binding protein YcdF (DUF218 family)
MAPGEHWILVTAAMHMPRSIGAAREAGWTVLPWATDYETPADDDNPKLHWNVAQSLLVLDSAVREWLGLAIYRAAGRVAVLFPAPEPVPAKACG